MKSITGIGKPAALVCLLLSLALTVHAYQTPGQSTPSSEADAGVKLQSLWEKGERAMAEGRVIEALEAFQAALSIDPDNGRTWNYLGSVCFVEGDYYKALLRFKRAAEASPDDSKIFNNLATTYDQIGQYADAIENYILAIDIDPDYPLPYRNLGAIYAYKVRDPNLAAKYWNIYLRLSPDGADSDNIREELEKLKINH